MLRVSQPLMLGDSGVDIGNVDVDAEGLIYFP